MSKATEAAPDLLTKKPRCNSEDHVSLAHTYTVVGCPVCHIRQLYPCAKRGIKALCRLKALRAGQRKQTLFVSLATLQADIMSCQCLQDQPGSSPPVLLSPARCGAPLISVSSENGSAQSTCGNSLRARAARPLGLGVQDAFPPAHPTVVWVQVWA